jgi:hypothetical protein
VRRDGAEAALLDEDLVGVGGGEVLLRCDGANGVLVREELGGPRRRIGGNGRTGSGSGM